MLDSIDPQQFTEWMAEYRIQPWGVEPVIEEDKPQSSLAAMRKVIGV